MGKYINKVGEKFAPAKGKVEFIIKEANGQKIAPPTEFVENLVCVINNGPFEAAAYTYSEKEMQEFLYPDGRPRQWLIVPNAANIAS